MIRNEQQREDIVRIGRKMYERGWIAATDGNVSVRLEDGCILATPTGSYKGELRPEDLLICDCDGNRISGSRERTTEMAMHVAIYCGRPDIYAVVHAHPPIATGFAVAGRPLNHALLPEVIVAMGSIPLADYGLPGTSALVEGMLPYIPKYDAMLLANHGAVAYGANLNSAFDRLDTLEHFARITLVAELLGGAKALPRAEVEKLFQARSRYGVHVSNGLEPGNPLTAEDISSNDDKPVTTKQELLELIDQVLRTRGVI